MPATDVTIVVLSRYPDLFDRVRADINLHTVPFTTTRVLVRDGHAIVAPVGWVTLQGPPTFNYSRNVNLGWAFGRNDIIMIGDDVRIESSFVSELRRVAYSDPRIAVAVPELGGQSIFVFCYIKRSVIDAVGYLDEQFDSYGYQDNDFYRRYEDAGYHTQPTPEVKARHVGGTSFLRRHTEGAESMQSACDRMRELYDKKWSNK